MSRQVERHQEVVAPLSMIDVLEYRKQLGTRFRGLRDRRGMSTRQVAERAAMSQSKLLRIEAGIAIATPDDATLILDAVRATAQDRRDVKSDIQTLNSAIQPGFELILARSDQTVQDELSRLVDASDVMCSLDTFYIPGMLQTLEYALAVMVATDPGKPRPEEFVAARVQRQLALNDETKEFRVLLFESALMNRFLSPADLVAQYRHILAADDRPNVTIGVVPSTLRLEFAPGIVTWVYDSRYVCVDIGHGVAGSHWPEIVDYHVAAFEFFERNAIKGDDLHELIDQRRRMVESEEELIDIRS